DNKGVAGFKAMLDQPENKQLLALLTDCVSHEMFSYCDMSLVELLRVMNQVHGAMNSSQIKALANDTTVDQGEAAQKALELFAKQAEQLRIPDMVFGFKLAEPQRAVDQIARLEQLGSLLGQFVPQLKGRLRREKVGDAEFLTLQLDGSLIPWES